MKPRIICLLAMLTALPMLWAQKLVFTPQWTAQAQFAGYYVAKEKGFYKEAGVDVEIVHPSVSESAISRINNSKSHVTTLQLAQAIEMADKDISMVNILQTSMNNSMVLVSRRGKDPLTQKGERVGIWRAGFTQLALCMSEKEKLNYKWIPITSNVNLFVAGAIDAIIAMSYNEYYQLLQTGIEMTEKNVYRFSDHGYNIQEDGVYMEKSYYERHREQAKRFARASRKGWEWAASHPDETLEIVMKYVKANHIATNRVLQKMMLQEVLRLQIDKQTKKREFRLRPDMVRLASQLMLENKMISHEVTYEQLLAK